MAVIETGKNVTNNEPQTRTATRLDPIARDLQPQAGSGSWAWQCPQRREETRTITTTYEWSTELVATGGGTVICAASHSESQTISSGYEVQQVLPGCDVVRRWKQTVDRGSWTGGTWEDTEGLPIGWEAV